MGERPLPGHRLPRHRLLRRAQVAGRRAEEPGRGRPRNHRGVRQARHPARRAEAAERRGGGRRSRQRVRRHDVSEDARRRGRDLLPHLGGGAEAPGAGAEVSRLGRPVHRQLLRHAQLRRVQRRVVLLRPARRPLPDRADDVLPHQRAGFGAVRAHADYRRQGQLRELSGGLHRAHPQDASAARGGRGAGGAGGRRDKVLHAPKLVSRRQRGQRRRVQLRHQARRLPRARLQDQLDAGRDRLRRHVEIPQRDTAGR